ncbi:MAG TPA: RlpA-like double-psi beta-barrel domain-containing protein [Coriobacteriia bacterium]
MSAAAAAVLALPATVPGAAATPASNEASQAVRIPYPDILAQPPVGLDEATRRAADLQKQVRDLEAESASIEARIKSTTDGIYRQSIVVEAARAEEASAQAQFDDRVIGMYKAGTISPLELILSAPTFRDALDRGIFLVTIVERDQQLLRYATRVSSDAAYQAQVLDQLRADQVALRRAQDDRVQATRSALGEAQQLIAKLNEQQRKYLAAKAAWDAAQRDQWAKSSYYGADVPKVPAEIDQYPGKAWLVDKGEPLHYTTTGIKTVELCSWYGNGDNAPTPTSTASGRKFNENEFTCATVLKDPRNPSQLMPFGTRFALTRGDRRIIVTVTDRGPYIGTRTIDLSKSAAHALGFDGVERVNVEIVLPK